MLSTTRWSPIRLVERNKPVPRMAAPVSGGVLRTVDALGFRQAMLSQGLLVWQGPDTSPRIAP